MCVSVYLCLCLGVIRSAVFSGPTLAVSCFGHAGCWRQITLQVNLLHDKEALEGVAKAAHKNVPDVVHSYFGPYIGVYFAWLSFYTK